MRAQEAILAARNVISEYFADDGIQNVALEEVQHLDGVWEITIGFNRSWQMSFTNPAASRVYKVVSIRDDDREVISILDREE